MDVGRRQFQSSANRILDILSLKKANQCLSKTILYFKKQSDTKILVSFLNIRSFNVFKIRQQYLIFIYMKKVLSLHILRNISMTRTYVNAGCVTEHDEITTLVLFCVNHDLLRRIGSSSLTFMK